MNFKKGNLSVERRTSGGLYYYYYYYVTHVCLGFAMK